jgi:hypothetical protein
VTSIPKREESNVMAEYDILVECQVIIEANNEEEAKNIAIKNIQNCLDPYYIEVFVDEN